MTKFVLDGKELEVVAGTTILKVARAVDIEIPTFCYQDRLTTLASCRMCLVEIEGRRKLEPACATEISEDMVIHTRSDKVVGAREDMLEILLANHPLDCPICDKGGECELQDTVFEYAKGDSRFYDSKRVFRTRDIELNDVIVFNANRCIQCQRCVRVCEEVVGDVALGTSERGLDSEITGVGNSLKDCSHCGNCIEVCPVGALMSTPYRYKARPWDLVETETICAMCGTGCSLTAQTRDGKLMRVKSKYEKGLNGELLCAKGRFGLDFIETGDRIVEPMIRKKDKLEAVSWEEAISFIATSARAIIENGGQISGQISPRQTNETAYMFQKLMREVFRSESISSSTRFDGLTSGDPRIAPALVDVMARLYSRKPLQEILKSNCILLLGSNMTDENPVSGYLTRTAINNTNSKLFIASSRPSGLDDIVSATFRLLPGMEGTLLAELMSGGSDFDNGFNEFIDSVQTGIANTESLSILIGTEFLRTENAINCLQNISKAAGYFKSIGKNVSIQFLFDRPNQMGVWDMGCLSGLSAGWRISNTNPKLETSPNMTYILGSNPVGNSAHQDVNSQCAETSNVLIVQGTYFSKTAKLATVLLPSPSYGEECGSYTNNEGRVQKVKRIKPPAENVKSTIEVLNAISFAMGNEIGLQSPDDVLDEIIKTVEGYKNLNYNAENDLGITSYSLEKFDRPIMAIQPAVVPKATNGSYFLITGDGKFSSGNLSKKSKTLPTLGGGQYAEMNFMPQNDLEPHRYEIMITGDGDEITMPLKLNKDLTEGVIYVPESFLRSHSGTLLRKSQYPYIVNVEVKLTIVNP